MFKTYLLFTLLVFGGFLETKAEDPLFHLTFDQPTVESDSEEKTIYSWDHLQSTYSKGIQGKALDLSEDASRRSPVRLNSDPLSQGSFSVEIWIRTKPGALQGTPIIGNKSTSSLSDKGWVIYGQPTGAWAIHISDSIDHFEYTPTRKQSINDGDWHQLAFSLDRDLAKMYLYFDGRNVAIYNIHDLGNLQNKKKLVIGGSDEYFEYGSYGQWESFNGYVDEVKGWDYILSDAEIQSSYELLKGKLQKEEVKHEINQLKVLTWNIWHGGRRTGEVVGLQRTIDLIRRSESDIICMQETYGSGAIIADSLGYYFYLISSNLSIMSRYPVKDVQDVYKSFNSGCATIQLPDNRFVMVYCIWLHYLPDYMKDVTEMTSNAEQLIENESETRLSEIIQILDDAKKALKNSDQIPVLMCGDFNSGSHLDWTDRTRDIHNNYTVQWPVSMELYNAGLIDSYRISHYDPLLYPGITWTPRASTHSASYGQLDRIDYIYYKGNSLEVLKSEVIDYHPVQFPSDHAAVITTFGYKNIE